MSSLKWVVISRRRRLLGFKLDWKYQIKQSLKVDGPETYLEAEGLNNGKWAVAVDRQ